ncbi:hypothetical protein J4461_03380 [Candidatus Pacearchaeota archaeon]|nr:hypothetical protein [Candidatus Pacearchaeota archaeon]
MRKKENNKSMNSFVPIILILSVFVIAGVIMTIISLPLTWKEIEVRFIVGSNPGLDINNSGLIFGKIVPGGSATRIINIENTYNKPIIITLVGDEFLKPILSLEQPIKLSIGEKKKVPVTLSIPKNYSFGNYTGSIELRVRRAYSYLR